MGLLAVLGLRPAAAAAAAAPGAVRTALAADRVDPIDDVDAGGPGAVDKNEAALKQARATTQQLIAKLAAHAQKDRIKPQIDAAQAKLKAADDHVAKKEWKQAATVLGEVKPIVAAATKLADDWANYARARAKTMALILAFKTTKTSVDAATGIVRNTADTAAQGPPPNFKLALDTLKALDDKRKPAVADLVKNVKTRLAIVEKLNPKVKGFLDAPLAEARPLVATAEKAMKEDDPALSRQAATSALRLLGPAERRAGRRAEFDGQRAATVKSITAVRANAAVTDRAKDLDAALASADALAATDTLKIEEAVQKLADARKRADTWLALARTIAGTRTGRKAADAALASLDKHAAAARITAERDAIRKLLADAGSLASLADGAPDPAAGWTSAQASVVRATADLALATKLADGMGAAAGAEAAAAKPGDLPGLKTALDKLRNDAKAARAGAHAKAAAAEYKTFDTQAAAAGAALDKKDGAAAATALAAAAKALVDAKTNQAEHGQFQSTVVTVDAALKKLQASPRAAKIKGRIDPVATGLAAAKAADQAGKGPEAIVALRAANDAVAAARKADEDRAAHDARSAAAGKRVAAEGKDAPAKAAFDKEIADAGALADAFRFAEAEKALQALGVKLDKVKLEGLMGAASPKADKIAALAKEMTKNGGAKTIDTMIQAVPNGGNADLIAAMASGRYGVKFSVGPALGAGGDPAAAMKVSCEMFSRIPQDIVNNKSISSVAFEDLAGGISAGHSYATAAVTMKGRAGAVNQEFGSKLKEADPANPGAQVDQLPAVEEKCKPANETAVDFLNFAAAHEVGHGVDEARGFMKTNGKNPEYGGWVTFGGNLQPLVDAIAATPRFAAFCKTPAQKKYVLDKLQSRDPQAPAAAAGAEANAKRLFDLWHDMATSSEVFRRQGDSESLKLSDNKIYHEAYGRVWVGYDADARKRGLTGYQFRAPGEWFAELYAGYRSNKLKPDHPAVSWLKKL